MLKHIGVKAAGKVKETVLIGLLRATLAKNKLDQKVKKALKGGGKPDSARRLPIKTSHDMKILMGRYYIKAKVAANDPDKMIAWITSGGPVEILHAAGVTPIYPENHAAMMGTTRLADAACEVAEGRGYSRDVCSYARSDLGQVWGSKSPIGGLPKPDFLVCCNNICGTVTKWYEELSRFWDVPMFLFDTPFIHKSKPGHATEYVKQQCLELIEFLQKQTGKKWSDDRFAEVAMLSVEGVDLWKEVLKTAESRPSPFTCFDAFIHMAPIVTLRGTQEVVDYYKLLRDEMQ